MQDVKKKKNSSLATLPLYCQESSIRRFKYEELHMCLALTLDCSCHPSSCSATAMEKAIEGLPGS